MLIYLAMIDNPEERDFFEAIYTKYRFLMLHVANKVLQNHHDAEDAVHEAFIAVIKNIKKFSDVTSPKTRLLIVLIVERKAIDILRKRQKENWIELNEDIIGIEVPAPGDLGIADAIVRLNANHREVLLMRYDVGLTNREIAELLGITESGVRKLLGRAKSKLKSELQKDGVII